MTIISKSNKLVTFINIFTVEPANQQQLLDLLARATDTAVRHAPGFISANLHRGLDGTKVVMYAQWRSIEDYEAMRQNPAPLPYLQEALTIAKFEPGTYEVVETYSASSQMPPNKSLDASGGSVFLNLIHPAMLEWIRAAASTQTLCCFLFPRLHCFGFILIDTLLESIYILRMEYDKDKVDDLVLALLHLTSFREHGIVRAWKSHDWDALDRLCDKGFINDPKSKSKSVVLSHDGAQKAQELFQAFCGA